MLQLGHMLHYGWVRFDAPVAATGCGRVRGCVMPTRKRLPDLMGAMRCAPLPILRSDRVLFSRHLTDWLVHAGYSDTHDLGDPAATFALALSHLHLGTAPATLPDQPSKCA